MTCPVCGRDFDGRANRLYCSPRCKKRAEHCRTRLRTLTERYVELNQKADAAKAAGDLDRAHQCRVRARRAYSALHKLSDSPLFDDNAQWAAPLRAVLLSLRNRPTNRPMNKGADRYAEGSTQQR